MEKSSKFKNIVIDQRDFKNRTQMCRCGCQTEIKYKVQAEVDVAIAVYLIDYALCSSIENIVLFAGDRDFIDSIIYVKRRLMKNVIIMGFEDNTGQRIKNLGNFLDVTQDIYRMRMAYLNNRQKP